MDFFGFSWTSQENNYTYCSHQRELVTHTLGGPLNLESLTRGTKRRPGKHQSLSPCLLPRFPFGHFHRKKYPHAPHPQVSKPPAAEEQIQSLNFPGWEFCKKEKNSSHTTLHLFFLFSGIVISNRCWTIVLSHGVKTKKSIWCCCV